MDPRSTVMAWDAALRYSDWERARSLLTADATYVATDPPIDCATPDQIVDLMRSFKGVNPDVELLDLDVIGDHAVVSLRQPAWDWEWCQLITFVDDRISRLEDFPTREAALAAIG
jgi:SnoaL-like domain